MSRSGIIVVGLKDDESKHKEALREHLVMFLFNPPLFGFHWHGLGRKSFLQFSIYDFFVVVFYLEDERDYQCIIVSNFLGFALLA